MALAAAGSTAGYVIHQLVNRPPQAEGEEGDGALSLTVGAPLATTLIAGLIGVLAGRKRRRAPFLAGLGLAAVGGLELDRAIRDAVTGAIEKKRAEPAS
jgi:hypothetical protein